MQYNNKWPLQYRKHKQAGSHSGEEEHKQHVDHQTNIKEKDLFVCECERLSLLEAASEPSSDSLDL